MTRWEIFVLIMWTMTFQTRKATLFVFWHKVMGQVDVIAYRRAKRAYKMPKHEYETVFKKVQEFYKTKSNENTAAI